MRSNSIKWLIILVAISFIVYPVHAVEIRGSVATGDFEWNPQNFAGFYYDLENDLGTETIRTTITEGNKLQEPTGVMYTTTAQKKSFKFEDWGCYNVIGFLAKKYFAGYLQDDYLPAEDQILFKGSNDENSLNEEQLQDILIDSNEEAIITPGTPLKLAEDYVLAIKYIDNDGMFLELTKNNIVVDSKILSPSKNAATMADKTYYYKRNVGEQKGFVVIAVHFKNALIIENQTMATVDGLWQISDSATKIEVDTEYDKMRIASVDSTNAIITMDNKDNTITLSRNKDISLMEGIGFKTADADYIRYYIYTEEPCECE